MDRLLARDHARREHVIAAQRTAPDRVGDLVALEPSDDLMGRARQRAGVCSVPVVLVRGVAEQLPFATASFDVVLATLVMCSVVDSPLVLSEVRRVLRPGGRVLMLEHVRSQSPWLAQIQRLVTPCTVRLAGGCHQDRDTPSRVLEAGFSIDGEVRTNGSGIMVAIRATRA